VVYGLYLEAIEAVPGVGRQALLSTPASTTSNLAEVRVGILWPPRTSQICSIAVLVVAATRGASISRWRFLLASRFTGVAACLLLVFVIPSLPRTEIRQINQITAHSSSFSHSHHKDSFF